MSRPSAWRLALALALALFSRLPAVAADDPKGAAPAAGDARKVEVAIEFLTELGIAELSVESDPLVAWMKPVIAAVESRFRDEPLPRTVVIQVTLHPGRPAEAAVAGRPAPSDDEVKDLLRAADVAKAPRSKLVDCSLRVVGKVNGGHPDPNLPLSPRLETPDERRLAEFRAASTSKKLGLLRRWARAEALPILAALAARSEAQFEGVRDLGRAIGKLDPKAKAPVDVAALCDRNPSYWRATLEMVPGIPLVVATRVALHAANGEIDQARRYAEVGSFFDARQSAPSRLLGEFRAMLEVFSGDVNARIGRGIALNDEGKLDDAMATYDGVLKDYPGSAWAHYERSQTRMAMAAKAGKPLAEGLADWPATRDAILACDPLYPLLPRSEGAEGIFRLSRRVKINTLFKDRGQTASDLVRYADIARDLEVYGFAATLYWNTLTAVKPEAHGRPELLEDFLYCLESLGVKDLKENFRGDHAAAFARIRADRKKRVEAGPGTDEKARPAAPEPAEKPRGAGLRT